MRKFMVATLAGVLVAGCGTTPAPPGTSSSGARSSASAGASATAKPDRTMTVTVSGDMLWHDTTWISAAADAQREGSSEEFDFAPMFAGMKDVISGADVAICHEEVPVAPPGRPYSNYPVFAAPPATVQGIKDAGWDLCTTASNHSWDQGYAGIQATLDALDAHGIKHVGTARSQQEYDQPTLIDGPGGLKLAVVEGAYSTNGIPIPEGKEWAWTPWDADTLLAKAKAARQAGADIVMVCMHGGEEYGHEPTAEQVDIATKLTASPDVDLVYGHHVHVVQPWTKINGKWVLYGLGNFVAQQLTSQPDTYEGVTGRLTFRVAGDGKVSVDKAEYIPTYWTWYGGASAPIRVIHVKQALADPNVANRSRLETALARTRGYVLDLGVEGAVEA